MAVNRRISEKTYAKQGQETHPKPSAPLTLDGKELFLLLGQCVLLTVLGVRQLSSSDLLSGLDNFEFTFKFEKVFHVVDLLNRAAPWISIRRSELPTPPSNNILHPVHYCTSILECCLILDVGHCVDRAILLAASLPLKASEPRPPGSRG